MSTLARRQRRSADIWPGFVDALTSLIMVMIFVLLIFAIGQFALSDTLAGKNQALDALNARVAELELMDVPHDVRDPRLDIPLLFASPSGAAPTF